MNACMYLRKSRADEEMEKSGHYNTLERHKKALLETAEKMELTVSRIREEIASGENISHRPQMQRLLQEVAENNYDAVLVMDIDRLGRGNMQEQGLILDTFKESGTKIITPNKTYDLQNEFDEEYSEFEAFMARKELKLITRRMQRGRIKSVEEGNYLSPVAPYGYAIEGEGRKRRLVIEPGEGEAVRLIFRLYAMGLGSSTIAGQLNREGYESRFHKPFQTHTVLGILKNPVYCGKITWKKREYKKDSSTPRPREEWIVAQGNHEPLIEEALYEKVCARLSLNKKASRGNAVRNPLAGLICCGGCGKTMKLKTYPKSPPVLLCDNPQCHKCRSVRLEWIEKNLLEALQGEYPSFSFSLDTAVPETPPERAFEQNALLLKKLRQKKDTIFTLLEEGTYTREDFAYRMAKIEAEIQDREKYLTDCENSCRTTDTSKTISPPKDIVSLYRISKNAALKNQLLKAAVEKAVFYNEKGKKGEDYRLFIYLNI